MKSSLANDLGEKREEIENRETLTERKKKRLDQARREKQSRNKKNKKRRRRRTKTTQFRQSSGLTGWPKSNLNTIF